MATKTFSTVGAVLGFVFFLFVGLFPSMLYGGFAGVMLASGIGLGPVVMRCLIVFGAVMGVTGVAFLFMVTGAVLAIAVERLTPCTKG